MKNSSGAVGDFLMKCLRCCFWCFENAIRFINSNAYIEIGNPSIRSSIRNILYNGLCLCNLHNKINEMTLFMINYSHPRGRILWIRPAGTEDHRIELPPPGGHQLGGRLHAVSREGRDGRRGGGGRHGNVGSKLYPSLALS